MQISSALSYPRRPARAHEKTPQSLSRLRVFFFGIGQKPVLNLIWRRHKTSNIKNNIFNKNPHTRKGNRLHEQVYATEQPAGLRTASTLRHRQDVLNRVAERLKYLQGEPGLNEALTGKPVCKRGEER